MWAFLSRNRDAGILILRIGLGGFFVWAHGWGKLAGGIDRWEQIGGAMKYFGITLWPAYWGFMAMLAESLGALLVVLGFLFRPACMMLTITMIVAAVFSYYNPSGKMPPLAAASNAIQMAVVFFSLIFIGPGRYSVDRE